MLRHGQQQASYPQRRSRSVPASAGDRMYPDGDRQDMRDQQTGYDSMEGDPVETRDKIIQSYWY
jgi:hypothetical protein